MTRRWLPAVVASTTVLMLSAAPAGARAGGPASSRSVRTTWTPIAALPQAVQDAGGATFTKSKVYLPGGYIDPSVPTLYNHMQTYNPAADTWTTDTQAMPMGGTADAAVCSMGTKIYVVNGTNGTSPINALQIFDTSAHQGARWSLGTAPLVNGKALKTQGSGCALINGLLYLFGGFGNLGTGSAKLQTITWSYNPTTGVWADTGFRMNPSAEAWFGYTSSNNSAYVAGGVTAVSPSLVLTARSFRFVPSKGWKNMADMPQALYAPGMGRTGQLEVFGGATLSGSTLVPQSQTLVCPVPICTGWLDAGLTLNNASYFLGYASDATGSRLFSIGGNGGGTTLGSGDMTTL